MIRILGTNLDNKKKIFIALTKIYGIGQSQAIKILNQLNINFLTKTENLNESESIKLRNFLENSKLLLEGNLKRFLNQNIKHLIDINSYRGRRHLKGLPTRGQRTRTNNRTARKFKKFTQKKI